jgi:hypothetical protein
VVHSLATGEEREIFGGKTGRTGYGYRGWFPDGSLMSQQDNGQVLTYRRVDTKTWEAGATWTIPRLPFGRPTMGNTVLSPDLMTLYFWQRDQTAPCQGAKCTSVMLARDLETGRDREVFRTNASLSRASVSRDGREMAFIAVDGSATLVMVAPTAGGPPREILRHADIGYYFTGTAWTEDGGHVLAFCRVGEIWSLPAKGGSPEKSPLNIRPSEPPVVSPDGTQVALVGGKYSSEIWVMTGLFPDAKAAVR